MLESDESIDTMSFGAINGGVRLLGMVTDGRWGNRGPVGVEIEEVVRMEDKAVDVGVISVLLKIAVMC